MVIAKGRRENVGLLLNEVGTLVTEDTEKAGILNAFFFPSLLLRLLLRNPRPWRQEAVWRTKAFPLVEEDLFKDCIGQRDAQKSMGPGGMYAQVLIINLKYKRFSFVL